MATPVPRAIRLTTDGCCPNPFWSPDSSRVLFIDLQEAEGQAGLYAVDIEGGPPQLVTRTIGVFSRDWAYLAYPYAGETIVQRRQDRWQWVIPNGGRAVRFSPSGRSIAWQVASVTAENPDLRDRTLWIASPNGLGAQHLITVIGGGLIGWTDDEQSVLMSGRLSLDGPSGIWRVSTFDGSAELVREVRRPRDPLLSPQGGWLAFYIAFAADPEDDGLWLLRLRDGAVRRLDLFGAYRWRSEGQLLVIPLDLEDAGPALWEVEAASGRARRLTDPALTPLSIANNDWQVSPDGSKIVYLSTQDRNLWLLPLP
ncbi:MAG: hypothetical protein AB1449_08430 [Chloroflexota bacterium]